MQSAQQSCEVVVFFERAGRAVSGTFCYNFAGDANSGGLAPPYGERWHSEIFTVNDAAAVSILSARVSADARRCGIFAAYGAVTEQ